MTEHNRNTSTTHTNRAAGERAKPILAIGRVMYYDNDRGFGFADSHDVPRAVDGGGTSYFPSIRLSKERCREVEGTYMEPTLTRRPTERYVNGRRPSPDEVIMLVVPSDRLDRYGRQSYWAMAWGVMPFKHWAVDWIRHGGIQGWVGREVAYIRNRDSSRGRPGDELWRGVVEHLVLTTENITLRVRCAGEIKEVSYSLKDSGQGFTKRGNQLIIRLWVGNEERWLLFG
jgi:hypothetical protein